MATAGYYGIDDARTRELLLRGSVASDSGLGVSLCYAARQAEACGFTLALEHNADGKVSFVLAGALKPGVGTPAA